MKNKKPDAKIDPQSSDGTITTRAEQKQVEERLAIGANAVSYTHLDVYKRQEEPYADSIPIGE